VDRLAAATFSEANTTAAEEQSLPSLIERTLRQCATPAEIAVVCQFTYLESEGLPHCTRHVNVEPSARFPGKLISGHNANTFGVFKVDQQLSLKHSSRLRASISIRRAWCVEAEYVKEEQQRQQSESAIGLNVARIANRRICEADSHSRPETLGQSIAS
jgi:hypothetical protein